MLFSTNEMLFDPVGFETTCIVLPNLQIDYDNEGKCIG